MTNANNNTANPPPRPYGTGSGFYAPLPPISGLAQGQTGDLDRKKNSEIIFVFCSRFGMFDMFDSHLSKLLSIMLYIACALDHFLSAETAHAFIDTLTEAASACKLPYRLSSK